MKRPEETAKPPERLRTLQELTAVARRSSHAAQQLDEAVALFLGLSLTAARCLDILENLGPLPAGKLAEEAGVTSGAITSIADQLEAKSYVQRLADAEDRRKVLLTVTDTARELLLQVYAPFKTRWREEAAAFSDQELLAVVRFLDVARRLDLEFATLTNREALKKSASIGQRLELAHRLGATRKASASTARKSTKTRRE